MDQLIELAELLRVRLTGDQFDLDVTDQGIQVVLEDLFTGRAGEAMLVTPVLELCELDEAGIRLRVRHKEAKLLSLE